MTATEQIDDTLFTIENSEEEPLSFLLLEDLIWEYNERIQKNPSFRFGKTPLSVRPPAFNGGETIISPMTEEDIKEIEEEFNKMNPIDRIENSWMKVLLSNFTPALVRSLPQIREGIRLRQIIKELGLLGKVYYKTFKGAIYVILKGNQKLREVLTGTRYSNFHPKMVQFGLSKVSFPTALKGTVVTALIFYGCAKTIEGITIYMEDGELQSSFFSEIPAEVTKLLFSALAATVVGAGLVAIGAPLAVGVGIAIVAAYTADLAFEKFDKATGFTKAMSEATERLVYNMRQDWIVFKRNLNGAGRQGALEVIKRIKGEQKSLLDRAIKKGTEAVQEIFFEKFFPIRELRSIVAIESGIMKNPLDGFMYDGPLGRVRNFVRGRDLFYITTLKNRILQ